MTADSPELDRLDALAQAATEGPWVLAGRCSVEQVHDCGAGHDCRGIADTADMCHPSHNDRYRDQERADAEFIAATDPTTMLALIAELRQARAQLAAVQRIVDHPPFCGEVHVDVIRDAMALRGVPHEWVETTRLGSQDLEYVCAHCDHTKTEPRPDCATGQEDTRR